MEEPEEERPETLPQQLSRLARAVYPSRVYWGPVVWVAVTVCFNVVCNPIGRSQVFGHLLDLMLMGVLLCQPLLTALWSAWAPFPLKWRGPLGVVAITLLAFSLILNDGDAFVLVVYAGLFAIFWSGLALLRRYGGWRLGLYKHPESIASQRRSFSIAYLLIWTTVLIAFLVLGRHFTYSIDRFSSNGKGLLSNALEIAAMLLTYTLWLAPILAGGLLVLGVRKRFVTGLLGLPVAITATSALTAMLMLWIQPAGPPPDEAWKDLLTAGSGATAFSALFGLVLRWAGYRVTRD